MIPEPPASTPQRTPLPGCWRSHGTGVPLRMPRRSTCSGGLCVGDLHPAESIGDAVRFGDTPVPVAGPGAPLVAEFCVAEFAAASGCPPRPARPTSVKPSSCGTGSRGPGLGSGPVTWRRGGPGGSPARRSGSRSRGRGSWTPRSRRSRTGSGPAGWTGWSRRRSSGSCPTRPAAAGRPPRTAGTSTCTPIRCPSRAPYGCRPRSTSPTPWTSTPRSRPAPPGSPTSARSRRWTCAAPKPSGRWRAAAVVGPRHHHRHRDHIGPARGGAARAPLRGRDHRPRTSLHLARVANTRSFVDAEQVRAWCGVRGTGGARRRST